MAPQEGPRDDPAEDNPEEDAPADLHTFHPRKRATAPAAPRRREMAAALAPQEVPPVDLVEDDPMEEDPVEDDPMEEDPVEDDREKDGPVEDNPHEDDPSEDDPTGADHEGSESKVFYTVGPGVTVEVPATTGGRTHNPDLRSNR